MKFTHFIPSITTFDDPQPTAAKRNVPQWYKDSETTYKSPDGKEHAGLKRCFPVLDALTSGFMLHTWCDINIKITSSGMVDISFSENATSNPIDERLGDIGRLIPRPAGHRDNHLVWTPKWGWKTPRGWSTLVTHPLNRYDLPFTTMAGIIDSDKFNAPGNLPFFLREDFEGVIPKGTPFAQVLPMKRADWSAVYDPALEDLSVAHGNEARSHDRWYKTQLWVKKNIYDKDA
jgi:hypothetical protein